MLLGQKAKDEVQLRVLGNISFGHAYY